MDKREKRKVKKLKKQINELFIMGEISQEEAEALSATESVIIKQKENGINNNPGTSKDMNEIGKKLADVRQQRQPGPMLTLTLEKLNGIHMSHEEVRDLVHFSVVGPVVKKPKWAFFRPWKSTSQTIVIRVNCTGDYIENNEYSFKFVDDFFSKRWIRMHKNVGERLDFWKHMVNVPVSLQEQIREKVVKLKNAESEGKLPETSRLALMMSTTDMVENDYPWPTEGYIATKERYKPVSANSPIFFLDCEMCKTRGGQSELTRISLIREDASVVFDTLVKPENEITDYLTKFSGITPELMKNVDVRLSDVQKAIRAILPPDAILCGHSLEFDLRSMKMAHPYIIDIGLCYNLSGSRKTKTGLKTLVYQFLNKEIQGSIGHCSVEDSYAALELYKLKLANGIVFGNCEFGWDYDEYNRKKDYEARARDEEERKRDPFEEIARKKMKLEETTRKVVLCSCGKRIDIECIILDCPCQKSPAVKCILCLAQEQPISNDPNWYDWESSLLKDLCTTSRPLSYYMLDGNKTVMLGYESSVEVDVKTNKNFTIRNPSNFKSIDEYVMTIVADILNYKLVMVEMDYINREFEIPADTNEESEEGELPSVMPQIVAEIDGNIERLINSAAKFSLIILVFSSPTASVCYLKVKP